LAFRQPDIVGCLEIQPELGLGPEPVRQPERGVGCDGALAVNDLTRSRTQLILASLHEQ